MDLNIILAGRDSNHSTWEESFILDYHPPRIYRMVVGQLKIEWDSKSYVLKSPGLYWIPPMLKSKNTALSTWATDWIHYDSSEMNVNKKMLKMDIVNFPHETHDYWIPEWNGVMTKKYDKLYSHLGLKAIVNSLHWRVMQNKVPNENVIMKHKIEPALTLLQNTPEKRPNQAFLAELCQISTGYFHRCFKEYTGMSALEFQKKQLMNKVLQLMHCNKSLIEIAKLFNYSSSFSLSRDFKLFFKISPRDYKRLHGLQKSNE